MDELQQLVELGERFAGVDLKFRRGGVDWPDRWKAECFSSKHEDVRVSGFGSSPELAIRALLAKALL